MAVRLEIDEGFVVEFNDDTITIGSDPSCTIPYPPEGGVAPKHAVIRKIAGRWIVEVREADSIQVGDDEPTRMHWLNRGDVIRLTNDGPVITFEPEVTAAKSLPPLRTSAPPANPTAARSTLRSASTPTPTPPETDSLPLSKPRPVFVPSLQDAVELDDLKPEPTTAKPSKSSSARDADDGRPVPSVRAVPPQIRSNSWLDESTSTAANARRNRARRGFWLQMAGVGALAIVAIAVWQFGGGGSNNNTEVESRPNSGKVDDTTAQQRASTNSTKSLDPPDVVPKTDPSKPDGSKPTGLNVKPEDVKPPEQPTVSKPVDTPTSTPTTVVSVPSKPVEATRSATLEAVRDGVFAVIAKHEDEEHCFRLGTAWAATRRHLVTSGAIALAVEELQREGLTIVVSHPGEERPIVIKGARFHPAYRQAIDRAATAREELAASPTSPPVKKPEDSGIPPKEQLARSTANMARFDLGVLDIALGERLPSRLEMDSGDLPDVAKSDFTLIGFPFAGDDYQTKSASITEDAKERLSPRGAAAKSDSTLTLTMTFTDDVATDNWSGSPVFDRNRRVIGVYSRTSKSVSSKETKSPPRHAVIWLGRLREFAPEIE